MSIMTVAEYQSMSGDSTTATGTVQDALNRYTAIIERYCNRTWDQNCYTETYYGVQGDPLVLRHPDVKLISSISSGSTDYDIDEFDVELGNGFIHHDGSLTGLDVTVQYTAGSTAPDDVRHVLAVLAAGFLDGTTGGARAILPVVQETVYGVAATKYGVSGLMPEVGGHAELGPMTSLLDPYVEPVFA